MLHWQSRQKPWRAGFTGPFLTWGAGVGSGVPAGMNERWEAARDALVRSCPSEQLAELFQPVSKKRVWGYCERTYEHEVRNCDAGDKGVLQPPLSKSEWASPQSARAACAQRCQACARCRYFSLSRRWEDCSWFSSCNMSRLREDVSGFTTWVRGAVAAGVTTHALRLDV